MTIDTGKIYEQMCKEYDFNVDKSESRLKKMLKTVKVREPRLALNGWGLAAYISVMLGLAIAPHYVVNKTNSDNPRIIGSRLISQEEETQDLVNYVVKKNDTLSEIAQENGICYALIKKLNPQFGPNYDLIHEGDIVNLSPESERELK